MTFEAMRLAGVRADGFRALPLWERCAWVCLAERQYWETRAHALEEDDPPG
jgi:hypothetical protein